MLRKLLSVSGFTLLSRLTGFARDALLAWTLGAGDEIAWRTFVGLASITRIGLTERGPLLRTFNEMAHLGQPL